MQKVIGVRFRKAGKIHYFNPGQAEIKKGDFVIIETQRGLECLEVVISPREIASEKFKIEDIHRKADEFDLAKIEENHEKEKEAFIICQNKILEHKLPMNLIGAEYTFDLNKIIFSFTADGRVDFRELVKDLASIFPPTCKSPSIKNLSQLQVKVPHFIFTSPKVSKTICNVPFSIVSKLDALSNLITCGPNLIPASCG